MTRPDKHDFDTLTGNSWSVHGGNHADETTGAIRTPIVMANSYRLPEDPSDIDDPGYQGLVYTREHGANQRGLEEKLAKLDHGEAAAVFGTGMAALHAAFFTILNPGDHAIVSNVVYMRVAGLFTDVFPKKLGIEVDFVDITDLDAVRAAVRPNTRLVHTEVIANPDLRVADVPALADDRPRRRRAADHRLHVHPAADDAAPRPRRRPRHPLADQVLQRPRRRDGRRRHRRPRPRRGDPHRRDVARRRRHLPVQRLAHHARLHHPPAAPAAAVRERPGGRRVPRGGPARRPRLLPGPAQPRPARRRRRPALRRLRRSRVVRHRRHPRRPADVRQRPARHHLRRLASATTRPSSPTRSTPKAPPPRSRSRSATTASSGSPSAWKPPRTSSPTSTRRSPPPTDRTEPPRSDLGRSG